MFIFKQKLTLSKVLLVTAPLFLGALLTIVVLPPILVKAETDIFSLACENAANFKVEESPNYASIKISCDGGALLNYSTNRYRRPLYFISVSCKNEATPFMANAHKDSVSPNLVIECRKLEGSSVEAGPASSMLSYKFKVTRSIGCRTSSGKSVIPWLLEAFATDAEPTRYIINVGAISCPKPGTIIGHADYQLDVKCSSDEEDGWPYQDLFLENTTRESDIVWFCSKSTDEFIVDAAKTSGWSRETRIIGPDSCDHTDFIIGVLATVPPGPNCKKISPYISHTATTGSPTTPTTSGSTPTTDTTDLNYKPECDFNNNGITPDPLDTPADQIELGPDGKTEYECHFQLASRTAEPIPADKDGICPEDYIKVSIGFGTVSEAEENADLNGDGDQDDTLPLQCIPRGGTLENNPIMFLLRAAVRFLAAGIGIVITGSLIVTGLRYMTSRGEPQVIHDAKIKMLNITIGFVMYILTVAILNFLIPGGLL